MSGKLARGFALGPLRTGILEQGNLNLDIWQEDWLVFHEKKRIWKYIVSRTIKILTN